MDSPLRHGDDQNSSVTKFSNPFALDEFFVPIFGVYTRDEVSIYSKSIRNSELVHSFFLVIFD